jgi:hypothetical protein
VNRLFEAFYTTKPDGMGMGPSISRSIIEAHGGRLWACASEPCGAVFQFTLPPETAETVPAENVGPMRCELAGPGSETNPLSATPDVSLVDPNIELPNRP